MKVNPRRSKSIRANTSGLNIQENNAFRQAKFKLLIPSDSHSPVTEFFSRIYLYTSILADDYVLYILATIKK